jgi:putative membrane protein
MQFFLFIALVIAALAILFAAQNNDPAIVKFLFWEFESSLALILVLSLLTGAVISFFVSLPTNLKVRWSLRNQKKKNNELEKSLEEQKVRLAELETQLAAANTPLEPEKIIPETVNDMPESFTLPE